MDPGDFGEKYCAVRIVISRKYKFAARLNWNSRESGAQESSVYLVVLSMLDFAGFEARLSRPNEIVRRFLVEGKGPDGYLNDSRGK